MENVYLKKFGEKQKREEYRNDMKNLKRFLERTSWYNQKLIEGESITNIFVETAILNGLESILEEDKFCGLSTPEEIIHIVNMHPWIVKMMEEEVYAMAYSYGKFREEPTDIEPINQMLLEMRKK